MWQGGATPQVLSENFYEGIGMANQRSLLISPETMQGGGTLVFQCGDSTLGVQHIRLQWLENQKGWVNPDIQDVLVTPSLGTTQPAQILSGQPAPSDSPAWHGQVVVVPVTDVPQRIEQGVEFAVELDTVPSVARLELKENGLPWGQHLVLWINQERVGTLTPEVPDLRDEGFLPEADAPDTYVGWRDGSLFVPVSFFKPGDNAVQLSMEKDDGTTGPADANPSSATALPLAVKDVVFQLNYPSSSASSNSTEVSTSATPDAATPTGPSVPGSPDQNSTLPTPSTNTP